MLLIKERLNLFHSQFYKENAQPPTRGVSPKKFFTPEKIALP